MSETTFTSLSVIQTHKHKEIDLYLVFCEFASLGGAHKFSSGLVADDHFNFCVIQFDCT